MPHPALGLALIVVLSDSPDDPPPSAPRAVPRDTVFREADGCETGWRSLYYGLFSSAEYGRTEWERAAWVKRLDDGRVRIVPWPETRSARAELWWGAPPRNAIAILHTHPTRTSPRPSVEDQDVADRLAMPVYVISRDGVFAAEPRRGTRRVQPAAWYADCSPDAGCPGVGSPSGCTA